MLGALSTAPRHLWKSNPCFATSPYRLCQRRQLLTLAIETSCDDTAVAILEKTSVKDKEASSTQTAPKSGNGIGTARLLFNEKITAPNSGIGGIHPLEALSSHQANVAKLVTKAISYLPEVTHGSTTARLNAINHKNGRQKQIPDFVSVTRGPGMRANLNCGIDTAKGLATAWQVPLLGVHHMQAHALTPRLVHALDTKDPVNEKSPAFPFLTLLVSGGHTMLLNSRSLVDHDILATTADIAIGDALDKCGRTILPEDARSHMKDTAFARELSAYAFPDLESYQTWPVPSTRGQEISKAANEFGWQIQAPLSQTRDMVFSFTSISTGISRLFTQRLEQSKGTMRTEERLCFARTALGIAFEHLASRTIVALENLRRGNSDVKTLVVSGGVAANSFLRYFLRKMLDVRGFDQVELLFPPPWLCTDNAAMIAWCGMEMFEAGYRSELDIDSLRKWSMDSSAVDGILQVGGWTQVMSN